MLFTLRAIIELKILIKSPFHLERICSAFVIKFPLLSLHFVGVGTDWLKLSMSSKNSLIWITLLINYFLSLSLANFCVLFLLGWILFWFETFLLLLYFYSLSFIPPFIYILLTLISSSRASKNEELIFSHSSFTSCLPGYLDCLIYIHNLLLNLVILFHPILKSLCVCVFLISPL